MCFFVKLNNTILWIYNLIFSINSSSILMIKLLYISKNVLLISSFFKNVDNVDIYIEDVKCLINFSIWVYVLCYLFIKLSYYSVVLNYLSNYIDKLF